MNSFNWICPHCEQNQTVVGERYDRRNFHLELGQNSHSGTTLGVLAICCSNAECGNVTVNTMLFKDHFRSGDHSYVPQATPFASERIYPRGSVKNPPDYIPAAIREDYIEACLVRELSPKASATLSRRCLQGMIRHFCSIQEKTLFKEIAKLKEAVAEGRVSRDVSVESVDAIDNVRKVGNIGAHMEADVEHIIPVDPDEAQLLIELIESLFEEWYVAQHKRQARFAAIAQVAAEKEALIAAGKAQALLAAPLEPSGDPNG